MSTQPLAMWTVYKDPTDHPAGTYLARKFLVDDKGPKATDLTITGTDLEKVRDKIRELGTHIMLSRDPSDGPAILEVWV